MMFRVLVAEDEPPIMRSICKSIKNADDEFEVTATAINGRRAVEILENQQIDIVFTDIRMPVMDGLALAEWIAEHKPDVMVVIVSGYQDFEYARKAIEVKVYDYLLKPLEKDKLKLLLDKVKNELKSRYKESKEQYLKGAVSGEENKITADTDCTIMLVCAGAYPVYGYNTLTPASEFWNEIDVQGLIEGVLIEGESHIFFSSNSQSERYVVIETADKERRHILPEKIFERLCNHNIAVTLVYKSDIKMSESGEWFRRLSECMMKNLRLGVSQIIDCDTSAVPTKELAYSKQQIDYIIAKAMRGDSDSVKVCLGEVFEKVCENQNTQDDVVSFLNVIVDTYSFDNPDVKSLRKELNTAVMGFGGYNTLIDDIVSILMTIKSDNDKGEQQNRKEKLVDDVERYLIQNYNRSITNDILSKEFGFVPSYISRIFRQNKGVSPSEYLMRYRIKMAKQLLSENRDIMIKEVADMVGFKEPYYFSKTFKKETGVWPSEYHGE